MNLRDFHLKNKRRRVKNEGLEMVIRQQLCQNFVILCNYDLKVKGTQQVSFILSQKKNYLAREQDKAVKFDHDYQLIKSYIKLTVHHGSGIQSKWTN